MGCRSFLDYHEDEGGTEVYAGRNNLGVTSVNVPMAAVEAGSIEEFWDVLDKYCEVAHTSLKFRLSYLGKVKAKQAPLLYMEGGYGMRLEAEELVLPHLLKRGSSISLGYVGIHETVLHLLGSEATLAERKELAVKIVKYLHDKCIEWKAQEGIRYSLYGTPAESLCMRFNKAIIQEFGEIVNVTDKGYLTNSFHLDVQEKMSLFDKIDFEEPAVHYSTGGHITVGEMPSVIHNLKALETVWDYSYTRVPYLGINIPIDRCLECGHKGEFTPTSKGYVCPSCGNADQNRMSVIRRVSGYLGNPDTRPFNEGKHAEVITRVKHL